MIYCFKELTMNVRDLIVSLYSLSFSHPPYASIERYLEKSSKRVKSLFQKIYGLQVDVKRKIKEYVLTTLPKIKIYVIDILKVLSGKFRSIYDIVKEYTIGVQGYYEPLTNRIVLDRESVYRDPSIIDHENIHKAQDELLKTKGLSLRNILKNYGNIGRAYIEGWAEYLREKICGKIHSPYEGLKELFKKIVKKYGSERKVLENLESSLMDFSKLLYDTNKYL